MQSIDEQYYQVYKNRLLCDYSFFVRYFFSRQYGKRFLFSDHHKIIIDALIKVVSGETTRLVINLPPRYSKTELAVKLFVSWCLANNPEAKFIHLSYSDDLALDNSSAIRDIVKSDDYQKFFPVILRTDSDSKKKWFLKDGGGVYATSAGGAITGFGAGSMGRTYTGSGSPADGFSGCFPYSELVNTEYGLMQIGDIVTKRINVRVYSYNFKKGITELQPINTFFTNPSNNIIKVNFSDGSSIKCTPDHEIYTVDGWVEASKLTVTDCLPFLFSNVFNLCKRYTKTPHDFAPFDGSVKNNINNFFRNLLPKFPRWIGKIYSYRCPSYSELYLSNNSTNNAVLGSNILRRVIASEYFNNLLSSKLCSWTILKKWESAMLYSILHVIAFCSVNKVCKIVFRVISINVPNLNAFFLWANKGANNKLVNVFSSYTTILRKAYGKVTMSIRNWLEKLTWKKIRGVFPINNSIKTPCSSFVANFIKAFKFGYRFPVLIENIGHTDVTFCLEIRCNNNFYVSEYQLLVSNCVIIDDPLKPDDAFSETMRERINRRFNNTIASRTNSPETPIVVIMQRLHENDMAGFLLAGGSGEEWTHLLIPAISEDGKALWPEKHSIERLKQMEEADPYSFAGQYMQLPAPLGGGIMRPDNIQIIDVLPYGDIEWVRGWDFASTTTGDFTAGGKLGKLPDGRLIIGDMVKVRVGPDERDLALKNTTERDGYDCQASIPQDPGQAGLTQVKYLVRELAGYSVHASTESGNKVVRAMPLASQINVGNVLMLRGEWNQSLIDEMRVFPNGKFDDQIDALSRASSLLIGSNPGEMFFPETIGGVTVAQGLAGLPGAVMSALSDVREGTCGSCASFDASVSRCTYRNFSVKALDIECEFST